MRRPRALLAALLLGLLGVLAPASAVAAPPHIELHTSFDPDRLGAGTTIFYSFEVIGAHHKPPPALTGIDLHLPKGMGLATSTLGLATCEPSVLLAEGLGACPPNSRVGYGTAVVQVPFTPANVSEEASVEALFGPPRNEHLVVLFYVDGRTPISAQLVFPGELLPDAGTSGARLFTSIPVIPAVPEGPDVSVVSFHSTIGPHHLLYYRSEHGRTVAYHPKGISVPLTCPRHGFPFFGQFTFADGAHVTARSIVPCPPSSASSRPR